jgi:hypothetical protein
MKRFFACKFMYEPDICPTRVCRVAPQVLAEHRAELATLRDQLAATTQQQQLLLPAAPSVRSDIAAQAQSWSSPQTAPLGSYTAGANVDAMDDVSFFESTAGEAVRGVAPADGVAAEAEAAAARDVAARASAAEARVAELEERLAAAERGAADSSAALESLRAMVLELQAAMEAAAAGREAAEAALVVARRAEEQARAAAEAATEELASQGQRVETLQDKCASVGIALPVFSYLPAHLLYLSICPIDRLLLSFCSTLCMYYARVISYHY